jgi:hypothetical protein
LLPASVGVAILRHHLYDIDRLINRTLVYGLLTALLAGVYAAVVLGPWAGVRRARRQPAELGDRWRHLGRGGAVPAGPPPYPAGGGPALNRRRYDTARMIEAYSVRLRDEVDLDTLSTELLAVVDQTMEPTRVSLWLRPGAPAASGTSGRPTTWAY